GGDGRGRGSPLLPEWRPPLTMTGPPTDEPVSPVSALRPSLLLPVTASMVSVTSPAMPPTLMPSLPLPLKKLPLTFTDAALRTFRPSPVRLPSAVTPLTVTAPLRCSRWTPSPKLLENEPPLTVTVTPEPPNSPAARP